MPTRFSATRSRLGDVLIYDRGAPATPGAGFESTAGPIVLHLDTKRPNFSIAQRYLPSEPGADGGVALAEWSWQNGPGGAGTTIETPTSYAAGSSDFGRNIWLRRIGVAQPSGRRTELNLPAGSAVALGRLKHGRQFDGDVWITTNTQYVVRVVNSSGSDGVQEHDLGTGATSDGMAVFKYTGATDASLYVGAGSGSGIQVYDGTSWTEGEAGTERVMLETPYWTIGNAMATGGLTGAGGGSGHRLVGVHVQGTGFYYVQGDPKIAANWSAFTSVGVAGSFFQILATAATNRTVFFATGTGVYGVDALGHDPNLTKWVEFNSDGFTGYWATYWAGLVWFNTSQGLAAFSPDGKRQDLAKTFRFGAESGISELYGLHQVMSPSEDGLYVGIYNTTTGDSYIGMLLMDEVGRFRWSMAETVIEGEAVTYIQQITDTLGIPHLFIGTQGADLRMHLYVQDLPRSGDPEADYISGGTFRSATSWSLQLSRFNGGRPVQKTTRRIMLEADQLGADFPTNRIAVSVANNGGAFTSQGTATQSPRWSGQPVANSAQATSLQVKLDVTNAQTDPVVIRTASVLYSSHPELSPSLTFPVIVGEGRSGEDPRAMLGRLERAQRAGPLAMDDFYGRRVEGTVSIDDVRIVPEAVPNGYTIYATVTLLITRRASRFDAGDLFDGGYVFS